MKLLVALLQEVEYSTSNHCESNNDQDDHKGCAATGLRNRSINLCRAWNAPDEGKFACVVVVMKSSEFLEVVRTNGDDVLVGVTPGTA